MSTNIDVRVYPIDDPQGSTAAFASVAIGDLAAIRGVRIVEGEKGAFVAMPQSQSNDGRYHDVAFPIDSDLRKEINAAVLEEYRYQCSLYPDQRGYTNQENEAMASRNAEDIKLDVKVFPISEPRGDTLAFASVGIDDLVAIRGLRVVGSDKGLFVSMPQSKDKNGEFRDMAFPLSGDLRKAISNAVLSEYKQQVAERKQGIGERLSEGKEQSARQAAEAPARAVAKKAPGLGE